MKATFKQPSDISRTLSQFDEIFEPNFWDFISSKVNKGYFQIMRELLRQFFIYKALKEGEYFYLGENQNAISIKRCREGKKKAGRNENFTVEMTYWYYPAIIALTTLAIKVALKRGTHDLICIVNEAWEKLGGNDFYNRVVLRKLEWDRIDPENPRSPFRGDIESAKRRLREIGVSLIGVNLKNISQPIDLYDDFFSFVGIIRKKGFPLNWEYNIGEDVYEIPIYTKPRLKKPKIGNNGVYSCPSSRQLKSFIEDRVNQVNSATKTTSDSSP